MYLFINISFIKCCNNCPALGLLTWQTCLTRSTLLLSWTALQASPFSGNSWLSSTSSLYSTNWSRVSSSTLSELNLNKNTIVCCWWWWFILSVNVQHSRLCVALPWTPFFIKILFVSKKRLTWIRVSRSDFPSRPNTTAPSTSTIVRESSVTCWIDTIH